MQKRDSLVYCPLIVKKIDEDVCADAAFVAEDFHPERFASKEIRAVANWKVVC